MIIKITYIIKQEEIPIVNWLKKNIINGYNSSFLSLEQNFWEYFFKQSFGYNLKDVKKYAKHIKDYKCNSQRLDRKIIFYNKFDIYYWHNLYEKYFPIKDEIINSLENIRKKLFKNSGHCIQPEPEVVFKDVDKFDEQNNYDFYFLSTEDYLIRNKFKNRYNSKLKVIRN